MSEFENQAITDRLDTLIRLVATGLCEGKIQKDQIALLADTGLQPKTIAAILGTTPNTVNVALSNLRKGKPKRRRARATGKN